jgi:hypothetical protein
LFEIRFSQWNPRQPYTPELQRAIMARNLPILRGNISSYRLQIEVAMERGDLVAVNHRITGFLASYFDMLFAINRTPHPGEKRLMQYASRLCAKLPTNWKESAAALLQSPALSHLDLLVDGLEELLPPHSGAPTVLPP